MQLTDLSEYAARLDDDRIDSTIEELEAVLERVPDHGTAHLLLARAHRMKGRRREALRSLAECWFWLGDVPAVREEYLEIARVEPEEDALAGEPEAEDSPSEADDSSAPGSLPDLGETSGGRTEPDPAVPAGDRPEELEADLQERFGDPELEDEEDVEDLDTLIRELEGARIAPEPEMGSSERTSEEAEPDDEEEVVSETLARIYERQKEFGAAAEAYRELAEEHPDRSDEFLEKAREMDRRADQT